ncbi:MAG: hypothetical protein IKW70_05850 [Verrucomicrobia bacterium]|nr:hypothetical protein [Verrucomicrobiota bacterium]
MHKYLHQFLLFMFIILLATGCSKQRNSSASDRSILLTNSTFESAAREFLSPSELEVIRLSEPGTCPGHFDIQPKHAAAMLRASLIVRFKFQESLDSKIGADKKIRVIDNVEGLCKPSTYFSICEKMGDIFVEENWISPEYKDLKLQQISQRLDSLSNELKRKIKNARLAYIPVLTSPHQKLFCEWLGLNVIGTFNSSESASALEIFNSYKKAHHYSISYVIANEPEGTQLAQMLADKTSSKLAVFGNFPQLKSDLPFDELLRNNVKCLLAQ